MALSNRYEILFYVECINGNPNGDPDMGNSPRIDPQSGHGYITDVAIKRRIRNYIQFAYEGEAGMDIIMQNATNINRKIAEAREQINLESSAKSKSDISKARNQACELFYDVRTFGAVMTTGLNAGQVRGPVQFSFAESLNEILPLDISITRMLVADDVSGAKTAEEYIKWENEQPADKLRTMGRKQFIPYGIYEVRGFISANLADETGFDENDLKVLFEAILNMYEHDRSASKGQMSVVSPIIIFKHIGTDLSESGRARQAKLGCSPAQKLFALVKTDLREGVTIPRSYEDYNCSIDLTNCPNGVQIGFISEPYGEISWDKLPDREKWLKING